MNIRLYIASIGIVTILCANIASAEDASSANYKKADKLLPGETVVTPTGQKMKVWTTEGPVPVSRAPEPFEDREKTTLDGAHIVVDTEELRRNRDRQPAQNNQNNDSFAVGQ